VKSVENKDDATRVSVLFQLETHREMNRVESERKRRERTIANDPIIQKKLELLKQLQEQKKAESSSSSS
jgi:hypothetical protein